MTHTCSENRVRPWRVTLGDRARVLVACQSGRQLPTPAAAAAPAAASRRPGRVVAQNVRLVGYNDLQGRTALVTTTKSDPANGNWVYVGHHEASATRSR